MGEASLSVNAKKGKPLRARSPAPTLTGLTEMCCRYDVDVVRLSTSVNDDIRSYINNHKNSKIYVLHPDQKPSLRELHNLQSSKDVFDAGRLQKAMDNARVRKCPHEIRLGSVRILER